MRRYGCGTTIAAMTPTPLPELPSSHLCQVLSRSKARLQRRVRLSEGVELAVWANVDDEVRYCQPGHHTLSVYLAGGEGSQLKARPEAMGAPGRICIFTPEDESHWLVRSPVQFLHRSEERSVGKECRYRWSTDQ